MANGTIYPYGTNGQLPSSIGVIDDLTTGGADKALSAEMGKKLNDELHGSSQSYSQTAKNQYYKITDGVLDIENPVASTSSSQVASIVVPVTAGQIVTWYGGTYQLSSVHKFIFAACDDEYNVLSSSEDANGTYTVIEDGYAIIQGWSGGTNATTATVATNGFEQSKANVTDVASLVNAQIAELPYTDDIVPLVNFYTREVIDNGVLDQNYYAKCTDFIRISPSTQMLVTKLTCNYPNAAIISYYTDCNEVSYISGSDVIASSISTAGTLITAPSTAYYMRLSFGLSGSTYDNYSIKMEIASLLTSLKGKDDGFEFRLPKYVDGVTGSNVKLFTSQFMDGVETYYLRSGGSIHRIQDGEDVWSMSGQTNVVLCDENGAIRTGFTRNGDGSFQHFRVTARLNSKTNGDGSTKGVLFIGDSLMAKGPSVQEAYDLLTADGDWTIQQIGTGHANGVGEFTEGWAYSNFVGTSSPFYINGALDFQAYVAAKHPSYTGGIDYVIIALGTNDTTQAISTVIANAKTLIDAILDENTGYPNAKIAIGLPSLGAPLITSVGNVSGYTFKKRMKALNRAFISNFDDGAYNANVTCMAHGAYLYAYESYGHADYAVNQYCETTARWFGNSAIGVDAIHPLTIGYKQWGYAFYCKIRAFLAGNL